MFWRFEKTLGTIGGEKEITKVRRAKRKWKQGRLRHNQKWEMLRNGKKRRGESERIVQEWVKQKKTEKGEPACNLLGSRGGEELGRTAMLSRRNAPGTGTKKEASKGVVFMKLTLSRRSTQARKEKKRRDYLIVKFGGRIRKGKKEGRTAR